MINSTQSLKLCFVISLLCNLLLAGIIGGHIWWCMTHTDHSTAAIAQSFPPDQQNRVAATMANIQQTSEKSYGEILNARAAAMAQLKASTFDKTAYLAAIQHIQDLRQKLSLNVANDFANLAENLSASERANLAAAIETLCFPGNPGNRPNCKKSMHNSP